MQTQPIYLQTLLLGLLSSASLASSAEPEISRLPTRVEISFAVFINQGRFPLGEARQSFNLNSQQRYSIDTLLTPAIPLLPSQQYKSEGQVSADGLRPSSFGLWQGDQLKNSFAFDWIARELKTADGKAEALKPGAQDLFSFAYQCAWRNGKMPDEAIQITNGKKVYWYDIQSKGEQALQLNQRSLSSVAVTGKRDNDQIDIWLVPQWSYLPVKISYSDDKRQVSLVATRISVGGKTLLGD
jgi:hypothetical protein